MPERHRTHDVQVAGGGLRVGEWTGAGAPVLALHGLTGSHLSWLFLADALPGRRVLAPDLRGRGASRELPPPFGLAAHADDAAAVVRALVGGPVTAVGHSMGAFVAVAVAERHPELVERLVLVDGGPPFAPEELARTEEVVATIRSGLEVAYPDPATYLDAFRRHPAFTRDWSPHVASYLDYDLTGEAPGMHRSADVEAVSADQRDITGYPLEVALDRVLDRLGESPFLHADRGFLDDPPGLYAAPTVAALVRRWPRLAARHVPDVNHYTIVMSARGAAAVAQAVDGPRHGG